MAAVLTTRCIPRFARQLSLVASSNINNVHRNYQTSSIRQQSAAAEPASKTSSRHVVTMIPGDGVGPSLMTSVQDVFSAAGVPVDFEEIFISEVQPGQSASIDKVIESFNKNGIGLKGIIASPANSTASELGSLNIRLRRRLDVFANVVWIKSIPGIKTRHSDLNFVVIREQQEGEYSGLEHESIPGVVESLKIITRDNSLRIAQFAFDYAMKNNRKKVTAIHKANIMKLADGLFLECCKEVAAMYPDIELETMIVDNCCMQLVSRPEQFDVMVLPNLYGNIVDNLSAGLIGGAGLVPGGSYGHNVAIFEPGARHPFAEALGKNIANPTAILLSACQMLRHIHLDYHAEAISNAVLKVIKDGKIRTPDMGGYSSTTDLTLAVIDNLNL